MSAPHNLIVCGNTTTVTVSITNTTLDAATLTNVQTQLQLFKGVQLVSFNAAQSSTSVSLIDANATNPTFSVGTLSAGNPVYISYTIRANCDYTDTLTKNNLLIVKDTWLFNFSKGNQSNVAESDFCTSYRDQIRVPYLTMSVSNTAGTNSRVGGVYQRTVKINNSSIGAYLKNILYTNAQGAGVSVLGMRVNGTAVNFIKTPTGNANQDTLISYIIHGELFKNNTGTANNDTLFDANETVTVTEDLMLRSCAASRSSNHSAGWGCDGEDSNLNAYCNIISVTDLVQKSEGSVSVGFSSNPNGTDVVGGYCTSGKASVIFKNNGAENSAGAATMHNIITGIGVGNYLKSANGYTITALRIAGKNIPLHDTTTTALKNVFTADPDGASVGLTDADGDGVYDDLPIGKSFLIEVDYDVQSANDTGQRANCKRGYNFSTGLSAIIQYGDNCNAVNTDAHPGFFSPFNGNALVDNCSDPDAKTDGKYFMVQHKERRSIFNFSKSCNGQEQFEVKVTLPLGVQPVRDSMFLTRFTDTLKLLSFTRVVDTIFMRFDAHSVSSLGGDYAVQMGFYADCASSSALYPSSVNDQNLGKLITKDAKLLFPTQFSFICPPCNEQHIWYCDSIKGPRLHYASPPCPLDTTFDCPKGLRTVYFAAQRTTFAYADSTYSSSTTDKKRGYTKVAMPCDSVNMVLRSVVGNMPINDSLGIAIGYDNVVKGDSNKLKPIFIFDKGQVNLWHNGALIACNISKSDVKYVGTDTTKALYFDLNNCLLRSGITLTKGDSVLFDGNFSVNTDAPITFSYEKIPNFRAYSYFTDAGQNFWCEDYGETFRVGKAEILFSSPSSYAYPQGCANTELHYQLIVQNNDYKKYFGSEVRPIVKIDSLVFQMDTSLYRAFTTTVSVSIPGSTVGETLHATSLLPFDNSGRYVARFDTLQASQTSQLTLGNVGNLLFDFRVTVQPNCRSLVGSSDLNNQYLFAPNMYYRKNYYAAQFGDGSCAKQQHDTARNADKYLTYTNVPELSLTPLTNLSVVTQSDTATWTVKVCNNSAKGAANQIWLSVIPVETFPATSVPSAFKIISFEDITNPLAIDNLTVQYTAEDSSSAYIFGNGLSTNSPGKNLDDYCDIIRIKAVSTACNSIPLKFTCGWFCQTPGNKIVYDILSDNCNNQVLDAKVNLTIPFVQAAYINQSLVKPGICDTTTLEILVKNTDLGTLYNLKSQITIPLQGATLLPNSIEIAYPAGRAYKAVLQAPQLFAASPKGKTYQFDSFASLDNFLNQSGLPGFNAAAPNDSNQFKIRYRFTTDCSFFSPSLSYFGFQGKTSCGVNSNTQLGESLPLQIEGATLDTAKLYTAQFDTTSHLSAGTSSYLTLRLRNLTSQPSNTHEKIMVRLPNYINYVVYSSVGTAPEVWQVSEPTTEIIEGYTNFTWQMPVGLKLNEEAVLRFKVIAPDSMSCSGAPRAVSLLTTIQKDLLCTKSQAVCTASIITTSNGEQFYALPIGSDAINLVSSVSSVGNYVKINAGSSVRLKNANGLPLIWSDSLTNQVLNRDSFLLISPTKKLTTIKATADNSTCIAPVFFRIELADTVATLNFTISISDTTVDCAARLPSTQPIVSPNPSVPISFSKTDVETAIACGRKIARTWSATFTDVNGKQQNLSTVQTITQTDKVAPTITPKNSLLLNFHSGDTLTVNCINPPIFEASDVVVTDNCDNQPSVIFKDGARKKGICVLDGFTVLMHCAWVATDKCGNTSQFEIFIKIIDNTPPALFNIPPDITISTSTNLPTPPKNVFATDGCDNNPTVVRTDQKTDSLVTRIWTATDACGNFKSAHQYIKILNSKNAADTTIDRMPPQIYFGEQLWTGVDTTFKLSCESGFSMTKNNVTAIDNADKSPNVKIDSLIQTATNCAAQGFVLQKTYNISATDSSGNGTTKVAKVFFVDSTPPVFTTVFNDTTITSFITNYESHLQKPNVTDNCSSITTNYKIARRAVQGSDTLWVMTWTATDACGNVSTTTQNVWQKVLPISDSTQNKTLCVLFTNKNVRVTLTDTASRSAFYCLPILLDSVSQYNIYDNGNFFSGSNARLTVCDAAGNAGLPVSIGAHTFTFKSTTQNCVDSFSITVSPPPIVKPIAINDTVQTLHATSVLQATSVSGTPIIIFALRNDKNVNNASRLEIVSVPSRGIAEVIILDSEPAIKYTPDALKCSFTTPDVLVYRVCNANVLGNTVCDVANIYITNGCNKLIIYTGFSPNGDGVNDYFTLEGIEEFPQTEVTIFNRWGNEVFTSKDYKNDWSGTWNNKTLPGGTYFYKIGLKDGSRFAGYVQIRE